MAKFTVSLKSDELNKQLERALSRNPELTVKKVTACAVDLSSKSAKIAPLETGDLRRNCTADINGVYLYQNESATGSAVQKSTKVMASIGYSLPYALRQHEDLNLRHDRSDGYPLARAVRYKTQDGEVTKYISEGSVNMIPGGEAKFLEKPFEESKDQYIKLLSEIPEESLQ